MLKKYRGIIEKMPLFQGLNPEECHTLLSCLNPKIKQYEKNEYIANIGDPFDGIGNILAGEASVIKENIAGNRVIMSLLKPGDMFGEMAAYSDNPSWPASVQATNICTVFFLPAHKIIGECEKTCPWHRALIRNLLRIITAKALYLNKKVDYLTIKSMRGKLAAFLLEQHGKSESSTFMLPMNRNELADFLNVSRPSMSRELSRMREEGVIDFYLASIQITDINKLKSWVE